MSIKNTATIILASSILSACSVASATSSNKSDDLKLYVYQDCKQVDVISMNEEQQNAYHALQSHENKIKEYEKPLKEMERKLKEKEQMLDKLSDDFVTEKGDQVIVNKKLIKQHEILAKEMEEIVAFHKKDIQKLELEASKIKEIADKFEQSIKPNIAQFDENVHVTIGNQSNYRCTS